MKQWTSLVILVCMSLVPSQSVLMAKGGQGHGGGSGHGPVSAQNSNGNGQGTNDRDFGTDRAKEVGRGKKKGLYKDHHSIENGHDKDGSHNSHKHKDNVKKSYKVKEDKARYNH